MLFSLTNPEVAILMMGLFLFAVLLGIGAAFVRRSISKFRKKYFPTPAK